MVTIAQRFKRATFYNNGFADLQQSAIFKAEPDAQIDALGGENLFYITFGVCGQSDDCGLDLRKVSLQ
jgi:hypothetical protein